MTSKQAVALILVFLSCAALVCAQTTRPTSPHDKTKFVLIITGAGGEAAYTKQFEQWTAELHQALNSRFGFASDNFTLLSESGPKKSTADEVKSTFATLQTKLQPESVLFVFLIGHGSFDGREAKFNLVGRDLSAVDYSNMLASLPTKRVVILNMSSASGEFIKNLSAKGRIVITATKSGQEQNATRFPGFFITALTATDSDADQDGHISVLETFAYATRLTNEFYVRAGRLATEHALLEDTGDGVGREKAENGEGLLARTTYLDSLNYEQAAANAATAKMLRDRKRLEYEIETLIGNKSRMKEAEYFVELEKLFIELAKVNRSIKLAGS